MITPYYEKDGIVIYHGDARNILPSIAPPDSVDLILTDSPYGVAYETAWRSRTDRLRVPIANDTTLDVVASVWPLAMSALRNDRHWYAFASPRRLAEATEIFRGSKHIIAWDKGDRGTVGDLECGFGEAWEAVFYGMKGRRPINGKRPTVKPVAILAKMITWSTDAGELVLDPFAGSCTTARAAKDTGRRCICIELEEAYCEAGAQRLRQECLFT